MYIYTPTQNIAWHLSYSEQFMGSNLLHIINSGDLLSTQWCAIDQVPLYTKIGLAFIPKWINNYIHYKMRGEITYSLSNFNVATVKVWEWINHFTPHFIDNAITNPCWDLSCSIILFVNTTLTTYAMQLYFRACVDQVSFSILIW